MYMPWGVTAVYKDRAEYFADAFGIEATPERSGKHAPMAPIADMIRQARQQWHGADPGYIDISLPGDANGTVRMMRGGGEAMGVRGQTLVFDAATGHMHTPPSLKGPAFETESVMIGLHAGRYAPIVLRWLYFLCGLGGTAMVATGLVLWTSKRRLQLPDPERPHLGFRLVERLNIATIAGLPFGIAVYFLANRLLPIHMAGRADWEVHCLFIAWGLTLLYACARNTRRAWIETISAGALAFIAVPVVNALTTDRGVWNSLRDGDMVFVGFDLAMIVLAATFGFMAWKLYTRPAQVMRKSRAARKVTA